MEEKGVIGTMLDFSFQSFITTRIVSLLYILSIALCGLAALGVLIGMAVTGEAMLILLGIILMPIVFCLGVLAARVYLELIIVLFKIAENTGALVRQRESQGT